MIKISMDTQVITILTQFYRKTFFSLELHQCYENSAEIAMFAVNLMPGERRKRACSFLFLFQSVFNSEISIDFRVDLPARPKGDPKYLMVFTDRLLKAVH